MSFMEWSEVGPTAVAMAPWRISPVDEGRFAFRGCQVATRNVVVSRFQQSACHVRPRRERVDTGFTSVFFVVEGRSWVSDGRGSFWLDPPGDAGWSPGWAAYETFNPTKTDFVMLSVSSPVLREWTVARTHELGKLDHALPLNVPTMLYLVELVKTMSMSRGLTREVEGVLVSMVAALWAGFSLTPDLNPLPLYERARFVIQNRFMDPVLTPARLANDLHVSLRHLQRAFEQHGSTIRGTVQRAQLNYVRSHYAGSGQSLQQLCAEAGLQPSELRRIVRKLYGTTPTELFSRITVASLSR